MQHILLLPPSHYNKNKVILNCVRNLLTKTNIFIKVCQIRQIDIINKKVLNALRLKKINSLPALLVDGNVIIGFDMINNYFTRDFVLKDVANDENSSANIDEFSSSYLNKIQNDNVVIGYEN